MFGRVRVNISDACIDCTHRSPEACNFIKKETLAQVFSSEFCEISKNTFFCRTHLVAASAFMKKVFPVWVSFVLTPLALCKKFCKINSQENTSARDSFQNVANLRPATLLKESFWHRCFPVNFAKFLRTPSFHNISGWLLLRNVLGDIFIYVGGYRSAYLLERYSSVIVCWEFCWCLVHAFLYFSRCPKLHFSAEHFWWLFLFYCLKV